jgi:hypothetical protein
VSGYLQNIFKPTSDSATTKFGIKFCVMSDRNGSLSIGHSTVECIVGVTGAYPVTVVWFKTLGGVAVPFA